MASIFTMNKGPAFMPGYNDPENYRTKYPEDALGEELDENARVWKVYNDEAREYDRDMVQSWREMIDVLLVFAGLFSAAVTTFVTQAATSLEPDYSKVSAILLADILNERGSNVTVESPQVAASLLSNQFIPSTLDHWTCGLWFMSLTLSLVTSLGCVIVKQWLSSYLSPVSTSPRTMAATRHFRFMGLSSWHVPLIIGMLPQALVLSLFLFLGGMATFLSQLSRPIATTVIVVTLVTLVLYIISAAIPVFVPNCPYRSSLTHALRFSWVTFANLPGIINPTVVRLDNLYHPLPKDVRSFEIKTAKKGMAQFGLKGLLWLFDTAQSDSVKEMVAEGLSALMPLSELDFYPQLDNVAEWVQEMDRILNESWTWERTYGLLSIVEIHFARLNPRRVHSDRNGIHRCARLCQLEPITRDIIRKPLLERWLKEVNEYLRISVQDTQKERDEEQPIDMSQSQSRHQIKNTQSTDHTNGGDLRVIPKVEAQTLGVETEQNSDQTCRPNIRIAEAEGVAGDKSLPGWDEENQMENVQ